MSVHPTLTKLWDVIQTNGAIVVMDIDTIMPDGSFSLDASHSNGAVVGNGQGKVTQRDISFTVNWSDGTRGVYQGEFDGGGQIHGSTFDAAHPESVAGWKSSRAF